MNLKSINIPDFVKQQYSFPKLTPIQKKSVESGVLEGKSVIACAPTASGKTLVATLAISKVLENDNIGKAIYLVPLRALASEKFKEYQELLEGTPYKVTYSTGDLDSVSTHLAQYDLLILTTEKLDSLLRHHVPWLGDVKLVVVDEIHLLNDASRGPTLEIVLTLMKTQLQPQIIGLSATIGNPQELADWLEADLIQDDWRPVELKKGIHVKETQFYE